MPDLYISNYYRFVTNMNTCKGLKGYKNKRCKENKSLKCPHIFIVNMYKQLGETFSENDLASGGCIKVTNHIIYRHSLKLINRNNYIIKHENSSI